MNDDPEKPYRDALEAAHRQIASLKEQVRDLEEKIDANDLGTPRPPPRPSPASSAGTPHVSDWGVVIAVVAIALQTTLPLLGTAALLVGSLALVRLSRFLWSRHQERRRLAAGGATRIATLEEASKVRVGDSEATPPLEAEAEAEEPSAQTRSRAR